MTTRALQTLHAWDIGVDVILEARQVDTSDPTGRRTEVVDLSALSIARVFYSIVPPPQAGSATRYEREAGILNPPGSDGLLVWTTTAGEDLPRGGDYKIEARIHTTDGKVLRTLPVVVPVEQGTEHGPPVYLEATAAVPVEVFLPDPTVVIA